MESLLLVTILILIDGFLQFDMPLNKMHLEASHNPYFNRWFSAIECHNMIISSYKQSQSLF